MSQTLLASVGMGGHAMPLLAMGTLFVCGITFLVSGMRFRTKALSRRIDSLQLRQNAPLGSANKTDLPEEHRFKESAYGLAIPEQQQIARLFVVWQVRPVRALAYFTIFRLMLVGIACGLALIMSASWSWPLPVLAGIAAAIIGWFAPIVFIKMGLKKHRKGVDKGLPDVLELLAICVDAGISLEGGLHKIAHELKGSQPGLAGELALTWAEISILPNRDQAFMNLADRIDLPSLRSVAGTLSQSLRFGTPLAQSLRVAANEMRNDQLVNLEERANRLPALLTVPVMLLIMPTIFLIVGGPAVIKIMDIFGAGTLQH